MMTKASSRLQIDDRAAATINAYPPEDQRRIRSAIGHLLGWDVLERLGERVRRLDRKSTRLNSNHAIPSRMPSSA